MYGVIGDAHNGFKAYDSTRRTEEGIWVFEKAIELLYNVGVRTIYLPGDLIDDTVWSNWVEKRVLYIFRIYPDVKFIILGGNHDSTKTYTSVSALDVLEERNNVVVINDFKLREFTVDNNTVLAIPHMKSQREFKETVLGLTGKYDICLLHAMVNSKLDLGPNDLNIDQEMLIKLESCCKRIWIGHQHNPVIISDKVIITGSTFELNFGEIGPRYVYVVSDDDKLELIQIPQPRSMERIDIQWMGINDLLDRLHILDKDTIYKVVVTGLPPSEYSACLAAIDTVVRGFEGDMIYELIKIGHEEINISTIDASFDLRMEFKSFCDDNAYDYDSLAGDLSDAISALASEEEDLSM
jgi:DNA repair exonuclease SbcCD nuclease subunit